MTNSPESLSIKSKKKVHKKAWLASGEVNLITLSCAAGFTDATSFSLLDAKRTKQEKHAWGSIPHDPRARHFGSGQLRGTLKPVRRKDFKLTASRRFKQEAFSFPRCARKFPHEPRPQFGAMLPWPIITLLRRNGFQATKGCRNLALPAADCALSSFLQAKAAPAKSYCVAREGIFSPRFAR